MGTVKGGFQTVVRVWSREQIPGPHCNLDLTSVLPLLYLNLTSFNTSFLPHVKPGKTKTNKHKHFGRDGVWDKHEPSWDKGDPSLGQTGTRPWDKPAVFC